MSKPSRDKDSKETELGVTAPSGISRKICSGMDGVPVMPGTIRQYWQTGSPGNRSFLNRDIIRASNVDICLIITEKDGWICPEKSLFSEWLISETNIS